MLQYFTCKYFIFIFSDEYSCRGSLLIIGGLMLNIVACGTLLRSFRTKHSPTTSNVQLPNSNLNCLSNADTNAKGMISKFYKYTGCSKKTVGFDILLSLGCVFALCGQFGILPMVPLRADSLQTSKTNAAILYVIFGAMSGPLRYDKSKNVSKSVLLFGGGEFPKYSNLGRLNFVGKSSEL